MAKETTKSEDTIYRMETGFCQLCHADKTNVKNI